jgi:hypothetical protein
MGLYGNNFAKTFSDLIDKSGVSCYKIAQFTALNEGYLSNLRSGEKINPSPETTMKISLALAHFSPGLNIDDFERLFNSVGRSILIKHQQG